MYRVAYTKIIAALKFNRPFFANFVNFENVNLFLNANISVTTALNYTCHIAKFKLDIIRLNACY